MTDILNIVERVVPPTPWTEGDNIPWNDPAFSERMLLEHLNQDHDLASRKAEKVTSHAGWIFESLLQSRTARILDLACGPGLYTCDLAARGCECVGVDFSPASIRHAKETAAARGLNCEHHLADIRDGDWGEGFDLAMLIYGQINVFKPSQARKIIDNTFRSLKPGGIVLLEPQTFAQVHAKGGATSSWYTAGSGLFSDVPHLILQEGFWDDEARTRTERFHAIDASTGKTSSYAMPTVAYRAQELLAMLRGVGFENIRTFPSLTGEVTEPAPGTTVLIGTKG